MVVPIFSAVVSTWVGPQPCTVMSVSHVSSNQTGKKSPDITRRGVVGDDATMDGSMSGEGGSRSAAAGSRYGPFGGGRDVTASSYQREAAPLIRADVLSV